MAVEAVGPAAVEAVGPVGGVGPAAEDLAAAPRASSVLGLPASPAPRVCPQDRNPKVPRAPEVLPVQAQVGPRVVAE